MEFLVCMCLLLFHFKYAPVHSRSYQCCSVQRVNIDTEQVES